MAVSTALERLLRIRDLEEEQRRLALESQLGRLNELKNAMRTALARQRQGRELVGESVRSGQAADRQAGLVESIVAQKHAQMLEPCITASEDQAARLRQEVLDKRVECRQAETLIEETEARDALEASRRSQRILDDWFGSKKFRQQGDERSSPAGSSK
jgi:hypothetical protein